jgi:hypothetical protein
MQSSKISAGLPANLSLGGPDLGELDLGERGGGSGGSLWLRPSVRGGGSGLDETAKSLKPHRVKKKQLRHLRD